MTQAQSPQTVAGYRPTIAVLISGGGRSLENLAQYVRDGRLKCEIAVVISSNPKAGGISRARRFNLPCMVIDRAAHTDDAAFSRAVFDAIRRIGVDLVVMAGFLKLLLIPDDFAGRVINIHPALLPRYGGKGMYGNRVHEAVLQNHERESGCTVHYADNEYDHGPIILQKSCPVQASDTPATLAARVFALELVALPQAVAMVLNQAGQGKPGV